METINRTSVEKPNDFLPWTILSTLLCCLPFGVVAIIRSTQVNSYWAQGKYEEAVKAAADARKWTYWAVGTAVAVWILYFVLVVGIMGFSLAAANL